MATRAEWAERVERWEASGLSVAVFAEREHLDSKRLVWWRWKLRSAPTRPSASAFDFLPVRVVNAVGPRSGASTPIEIVLPNGRVVRVPAGFDAAELERILGIASAPDAC